MESPVRHGSEFYRGLIETIRSETRWSLDERRATPEKQIAKVTGDGYRTGELFFRDSETGSVLTLLFPDYQNGAAAKLLLDKPLDERLPSQNEGFIGTVCEAHRAIAKRHGTSAIEPLSDPSLVLKAEISKTDSEDELRETLAALETIASTVDELHRELRAVANSHVRDAGE